MKPKHKQSSLLSFFKKPKSTEEDVAENTYAEKRPEVQKMAAATVDKGSAQDVHVDDAVIEPSSPRDLEKAPVGSSVVSPAATVIEEIADVDGQSDDNVPHDEKTSDEDQDTSSESDNEDGTTPKKSDYELLRERNIQRNNERLKSLGLLNNDHQPSKVMKKKPVKRKKASGNADRVSYPTRRSTRMKKNVGGDGLDQEEVENLAAPSVSSPEEMEEEQFTVSPLFEYKMCDVDTNPFSEYAYKLGGECAANCKNLVPCGPRLIPPSGLNAIYSLQFHPNSWDVDNGESSNMMSPSWLVGAGKSGIVSLWDCRRQKEDNVDGIDPVVSWKAHGGRWVADCRFLPVGSASVNENATDHVPKRLLTAANDGTICHWDLTSNSVKTGAPKLMGQTDKSLHRSGIFSMDIFVDNGDVLIASGSKDKTIALSTVSRFGDAYWRSDFHSAKVGCVSLSSSSKPLIVSASDDGFVAVHDSRSEHVVVKIEDAHIKPHSAVWKPGSDSIFVTAGLDEIIKLWDVRNTSSPVASYHGHVAGGKRIKRIHRPTFIDIASDSYILSGGEGSHALSMFQLLNGIRNDGILHSVFNRGKLPDDHGDVGSLAVMNNHVAVAGEGGEILILSPQAS
jgi:hypothetical protein